MIKTLRDQTFQDLLHEGFTETEIEDNPTLTTKRVAQQTLVANAPNTVTLDPPGTQSRHYSLDTDGRPQTVYYASFGSNLLADRFNYYIGGGQPNDSMRTYPGCRNNTAPTDDIAAALNGTIHFAGQSLVWTGGVAFLDTETSGKSLGRAYRITTEQFDDVVAQECNQPPGSKRTDIEAVLANGKLVEPGLYGTLVHVGDYENAPVLTFTGPFNTAQARAGNLMIDSCGHLVERTGVPVRADSDRKPWFVFSNPPSLAYANMISSGLIEAHGLAPEQVGVYFAGATGFKTGGVSRLSSTLAEDAESILPP